MSAQVENIIIDDGKKTYNIVNQEGQVLGSFRLNPSDNGIRKRYAEVEEFLNNISEHVDMTQEQSKVEDDLTEKVKEQINYLFDCDCADEFFNITSPWSIMENGCYFLENVIEAVGNVIGEGVEKRRKKFEAKISKYTKKYTGKK